MEQAKIDISLIVVFHNEALTIGRALESFVVQTPKSVEYIFVDDGSTDGSMDVVRNFMMEHPELGKRFKLITNPECCGCANSAAKGLLEAQGEYVIRCDADDYLEPNALQLLLDATEGGIYDVVIAPYYAVYPEYRKLVKFKTKPQTLNDMYMDALNFSVWNKLLRRRLLVDNAITQFEGLDCWEDLGVVSRVLSLRPRLKCIDTPVYNYVRNPKRKTLTRSSRNRLLEDHLAVCRLVEDWLKERGLEHEFEEFLLHLKFCAKVKMLRGRRKNVARWKRTYSEVNSKVMSLRHIALHWRLMFAMVALLPTIVSQSIANCLDVFYILED